MSSILSFVDKPGVGAESNHKNSEQGRRKTYSKVTYYLPNSFSTSTHKVWEHCTLSKPGWVFQCSLFLWNLLWSHHSLSAWGLDVPSRALLLFTSSTDQGKKEPGDFWFWVSNFCFLWKSLFESWFPLVKELWVYNISFTDLLKKLIWECSTWRSTSWCVCRQQCPFHSVSLSMGKAPGRCMKVSGMKSPFSNAPDAA